MPATVTRWVFLKGFGTIMDDKNISQNNSMPGQTPAEIIAVGGGKGGIGKSVLSIALALTLTDLGKKVVLVDADLGGANLHTMLGVYMPRYTLYDFYARRIDDLRKLILPTPIENLDMICGAAGSIGMADIRYWEKLRTIRQLQQIPAEYVVVDLGAGSSFNEIDLFNAAHTAIVVAQPEPTSIQECYHFIKIALFRKLRRAFLDSPEVTAILDECADPTHSHDKRTITEIAERVRELDVRLGVRFYKLINSYSPKLVLNKVHHHEEYVDGLSLQLAMQDMLRIKLEYWGYLKYAPHLHEALRSLRPMEIIAPNSDIRLKILRMVKKFILREKVNYQAPGARLISPITEIRKQKKRDKLHKIEQRICSVMCPLWESCTLRDGGLPCRMPESEFHLRTQGHSRPEPKLELPGKSS